MCSHEYCYECRNEWDNSHYECVHGERTTRERYHRRDRDQHDRHAAARERIEMERQRRRGERRRLPLAAYGEGFVHASLTTVIGEEIALADLSEFPSLAASTESSHEKDHESTPRELNTREKQEATGQETDFSSKKARMGQKVKWVPMVIQSEEQPQQRRRRGGRGQFARIPVETREKRGKRKQPDRRDNRKRMIQRKGGGAGEGRTGCLTTNTNDDHSWIVVAPKQRRRAVRA